MTTFEGHSSDCLFRWRHLTNNQQQQRLVSILSSPILKMKWILFYFYATRAFAPKTTKFAIQFAYLRCIIKICSLFGVWACEWENPSHSKYNILEMIAVFSSVYFSLLRSLLSSSNWVRSLLFIELYRNCFFSMHTKYRKIMELIEIFFNVLQWGSNKFTQIKRELERTQHTFNHLHRNWYKSLEGMR